MGPAIKPLVPEKQKAADQLSAVHQKIRETLAFQRYATSLAWNVGTKSPQPTGRSNTVCRYEQWAKSGFRTHEQPDDDEGSDQTRYAMSGNGKSLVDQS